MNAKYEVKRILKKWNIPVPNRSGERMICDINRDCTREQKKLLISYLDYERSVEELKSHFAHTNRQEFLQMIRVCIEMDFCIDVVGAIDESSTAKIPADYYDCILGFGVNFRAAVERNPQAYAILYMTENPYDVSFARESERLAYFKERTGRTYHLERTGVYYEKGDEASANAILCFGDTRCLPDDIPVRRIWPSALKNPAFRPDVARKKTTSFLVYGVDGFIHKGNDLLVEIFARHPEWTLYLCGRRGEEKAREVGYRLPANVIAVGQVDTLSEQFNDLAAKCWYLLLPSCSEALPTSVITGMRHGLIPIVSHGIGLDDLDDYCSYFEDFRIESVEAVLKAAAENDADLAEKSRAILSYADEHYRLEDYTAAFRTALADLLRKGDLCSQSYTS